MGLDIDLVRRRWVTYDKVNFEEDNEVLYECNITHNLGKMAKAAGLYEALWRPYLLLPHCPPFNGDDGAEYEFAGEQTIEAIDLIPHVRVGLNKLKSDPELYKKFDSPNGWGTYKHFLPFVEEYFEALKKYPHSIVEVSR